MKQATNLTTGLPSTVVKDQLEQSYSVNCVPRLTVDWNLNRYFAPTADNVLPEATNAHNADVFPISSIVEPLRPTKGIVKAITGQGTVSAGYKVAHQPRFYMGGKNSKYKYWVSPNTTDGSGVFPLNAADSNTTVVKPYIQYSQVVKSNKIVIKVENTWASPNVWRIKVQSAVAGAWNTISTSPALANDGTVTLYYNGSTWVTTKPSTLVLTDIKGIRLEVDSLTAGRKTDGTVMTYKTQAQTTTTTTTNTTGANSFFSLIAIEAHREEDWTDRLISVDSQFDVGEKSQLYPIGTLTTNGSTINLFNGDSVLNKDNASSPYYGILESNIKFNLEYIYDVGGTKYSVQEFNLNGPNWTNTDESVIGLRLEDDSKFLKTINPRKMLVKNKSVVEIAWRLLDSIGYNKYVVSTGTNLDQHIIPVFYTDGTKTVWEVLDQLAQATQTAFYFDSSGFLQVKTRSAAFADGTPVWNFYGVDESPRLADIAKISEGDSLGVNTFKVTYKPRSWKQTVYGSSALDVVWKPEDDEILRSSKLVKNCLTGDTSFLLSSAAAAIWPYKGIVWIDGEIIKYEGKQYKWYTHTISGGNPVKVEHYDIVTSQEQRQAFDNLSSPFFKDENVMTGRMYITERGAWDTNAADHKIKPYDYTTRSYVGAVARANPPGVAFNVSNSSLVLSGDKINQTSATSILTAGKSHTYTMKYFGFRARPIGAGLVQRGGMGFFIQGNGDGYYIDIAPTNKMTRTARATRNEVSIISRVNGQDKIVSKGAKVNIVNNRYVDVDIVYKASGSNRYIIVYINGRKVISKNVPVALRQTANGRWAMFCRKQSQWEFEYVYASSKDPDTLGGIETNSRNDFSWYDMATGGLRGGWWLTNFVTNSIDEASLQATPSTKNMQFHYDEFNPYVHEIREYDVNFDPGPAAWASFYSSNPSGQVLRFKSDPFSAQFAVANVSRANVVLQGEDTVTYAGSGEPVQQVMMVLGQTMNDPEEKTLEKKNLSSITIDGEVLSELNNEWIQSEGMANEIAEWMNEHWSRGVDEINIDCFGNPLLEVTDLVAVKYPYLSMTLATHKFFVSEIKNSFDKGISTSITLRRMI